MSAKPGNCGRTVGVELRAQCEGRGRSLSIVAATWICDVAGSSVAAPDKLIGQPVINGTGVSQKIGSLEAKTKYLFECQAISSDGTTVISG